MSDTDVIPHENVNETNILNQIPFYTVVLQGAVSLQNIVDDPDINKDAKLLDNLSSITSDAKVSTAVMPHMKKFREDSGDARKGILKRIVNKQ